MTGWRPEREIEIIAGTPPGGGLDRSARALAAALDAAGVLDVPVRVVNVAGDGGRRAWSALAERPSDPHVLCISHSNLATDCLLGASPFRHEVDATPLAILHTEFIAFVVRADSSITNAGDLMQRCAGGAGPVTVALSTSLGNPNHIALAKVLQHAGADPKSSAVRVFDSALDAVADVLSGGADLAAVTAASPAPALAAGRMRALAVSAPQRLGGHYAGTPTWTELGVDCVIGAWRGATGPRGLPPDAIRYWEELLTAAVATREWRAELERCYWTDTCIAGAALGKQLRRESEEMRAVLTELGLIAG